MQASPFSSSYTALVVCWCRPRFLAKSWEVKNVCASLYTLVYKKAHTSGLRASKGEGEKEQMSSEGTFPSWECVRVGRIANGKAINARGCAWTRRCVGTRRPIQAGTKGLCCIMALRNFVGQDICGCIQKLGTHRWYGKHGLGCGCLIVNYKWVYSWFLSLNLLECFYIWTMNNLGILFNTTKQLFFFLTI